jgi:hypothetical protein
MKYYLLTLIIIYGSSVVYSETSDKPQAEISQTQVITFSHTERVFYKKGLVEKIEIDGYLSNPTMPLEFVACTDGGKDYESLVVVKCKPWNIHLGLILAGLKEGKGPKSFGDLTRPTGDLVIVFISWVSTATTGTNIVSYRVEDLLINAQTNKVLERVGWSFTGSMFVDDIDYDTGRPTGKKIYLADVYKNVIASWHDPAAVLNIPTSGGLYLPNNEILPARGTKITLIIRPPTPEESEELKGINAAVSEYEEKQRQKQKK